MSYSVEQLPKPQKALILQGDWEGGISNVALDMMANGIEVTKVVLNAADWIYKKKRVQTVEFDQPFEQFEPWLRSYVDENEIDCIIIYNQYRPYNRVGWDLAKELDIECLVLELGLLRPDFCTIYSQRFDHFKYLRSVWAKIEADGVQIESPTKPMLLGKMNSMSKVKQFGCNFLFSRIMAIVFRQYTHYVDQRKQDFFYHLNALVMNGLRYQGRVQQGRFDKVFAKKWSGRYFVVPLQVHCDSQITERSGFSSMEQFIDRVVESFLCNAPVDSKLVIKVHPMDRGYKDYREKIKAINLKLGGIRILYVDRITLPVALRHCLGCVTINSSVGISALIHQKRTICLGEAAFDLEGLTFQGSLDEFWLSEWEPAREKIDNFINLLKLTSQAQGVFYQQLYVKPGHCKIGWPKMFEKLFLPPAE